MGKIIVPQELVDQIINLYQNGKNRKQIKNELNLTFGDSVVKRILEENYIPIRTNPGAQAGGRKKQLVDRGIEEKIIDLYINKQYGLNKISRELNLSYSFDKIKSILQDNGVKLRTLQEANKITTSQTDYRKYTINDDYNLISHNGAWLLGFIAADGYLPATKGATNRITITLSSIDKEVLERIKEELNYSGPLYEYERSLEGKLFPCVSLSFTSKKLRQQVENFGIVNNKTFKLKSLPSLPDEYIIDFIRGYFDGDGSVIYKENRCGACFSIVSANREFLEAINDYLHTKLNLQYNGSIGPDKTAYVVKWGSTDSEIIGKHFYENNYLALPRKKQKFLLRKQLPRA